MSGAVVEIQAAKSVSDHWKPAFGSILADLGSPDEAKKYSEQALEIARTIGDQYGAAAWLVDLGWAHWIAGEAASAETYYERALGPR